MKQFLYSLIIAFLAFSLKDGHAQEAPHLDRLKYILEVGCQENNSSFWASENELVGLAAAAADLSLLDLESNTGIDGLSEFFRSGRRLSELDQGTDLTEHLIEATGVLPSLEAAVLKSTTLCDVIHVVMAESVADTAKLQLEQRDYYRPQSALAQALLNYHGCEAGLVDGYFGNMSRDAWARAAEDTLIPKLPDGTQPTPVMIAKLAEVKVAGRLCERDSNQPFLNSRQVLRAMAACQNGGLEIGELGNILSGVSNRETVLRRGFEAVTTLCREQWESLRNAQKLVKSALSEIDLRTETLEEAQAVLTIFRDGISRAVSENTMGVHEAIAEAVEAVMLPPTRDNSDMLALLHWERFHAVEDGGWHIANELVHQLGRDESDWPLSPAAREYFISLYAGSAAESQIWLEDNYRLSGFQEALETGENIGAVASGIAEAHSGRIVSYGIRDVGANGVFAKVDFTIELDGLEPLIMVTRLVARDISAVDDIISIQDEHLSFVIGSLLLEGHSGMPRTTDMILGARRLFTHAAENGAVLAPLRLAHMAEQGLGGPVDLHAARAYFVQAAELGHPTAHLALGDYYRLGIGGPKDIDAALASYEAALYQQGTHAGIVSIAVGQIWQRIQSGDPFFVTGKGATLIQSVFTKIDDLEPGESYGLSESLASIGTMFFDPDSVIAPNPEEAVRWLRLAVDHTTSDAAEQRMTLIAILNAYPNLAADAKELDRLHNDVADEDLRLFLQAYGLARSGDASALATWVNANCSKGENKRSCVELHHKAAIGVFGPELLKHGFDWLTVAAAQETGGLQSVSSDGALTDDEAIAIMALMDVTAFFGDYSGAQELINPLRRLPYSFSEHAKAARISTFRREIVRIMRGYEGPRRDEFQRLLQALAVRGDETAETLLSELGAPVLRSADISLADARERFAVVEPLGQGALALPLAARRLAAMEHDAGDADRALELELMALQSDFLRADASEVKNGPIAAGLTRVCVLSGTSERLYDYGHAEIALSLAKDAVNRLQDMRRHLADLPENLQLCFRDQVADHYRWLADLFIAQNRPVEADLALTMLKSFETFQFFDRDRRYSGEALQQIATVEGEEQLVQELATLIVPTVTEQSLQRRVLLLKKRDSSLTPEEQNQLEQLNALLADARDEREALLAEFRDRARAIGRAATALDNNSKSIKRYLRQRHLGKAATLQYVVLPDRIGAVLITSVSESAFSWSELDGEPFLEAQLNDRIAEFRQTLQTPISDPLPIAQKLHDFLLPDEIQRELEAAEVDTLILSLDRQLRYIPFAALHNGTDWLAANYHVMHATETRTPPAEELPEQAAIFGTTNAVGGFSALPGVQDEVDALLRLGSEAAAFDGRTYINDAFTRDAMASSLIFDDLGIGALGVVHIASHFKLGESEADSFLLLGDGKRLSVAEIREGFGVDLDFSEVGLLTLSACETGFGTISADGRELESFAAIAQSEGAQGVVATLWPVADESTPIFMKLFYSAQLDGTNVAEALSNTQRLFAAGAIHAGNATDILTGKGAISSSLGPRSDNGFSHPFYWAPIIYLAGAV